MKPTARYLQARISTLLTQAPGQRLQAAIFVSEIELEAGRTIAQNRMVDDVFNGQEDLKPSDFTFSSSGDRKPAFFGALDIEGASAALHKRGHDIVSAISANSCRDKSFLLKRIKPLQVTEHRGSDGCTLDSSPAAAQTMAIQEAT